MLTALSVPLDEVKAHLAYICGQHLQSQHQSYTIVSEFQTSLDINMATLKRAIVRNLLKSTNSKVHP
jgi:hypothetical protein